MALLAPAIHNQRFDFIKNATITDLFKIPLIIINLALRSFLTKLLDRKKIFVTISFQGLGFTATALQVVGILIFCMNIIDNAIRTRSGNTFKYLKCYRSCGFYMVEV